VTRFIQDWADRFEASAATRTRLAATASLPAYVTELDAPGRNLTPVGNAWSSRLFDGPFYVSPAPPRRPACSLVFVQSLDGNTGATDPGQLGGGSTDKHLIYEGLSRVAADAVMAGAETVRGSETVFSVWHPALVDLRASLGLPRHPTQIVATIRGIDLDEAMAFNVPDVPVLLLTVASAAQQMHRAIEARSWVTPLLMKGSGELPRVFETLRSLGIERVSCVGGRTLAGHLLDARLIDDVYLTTAARAGGEPDTPMYARPWRGRVIVRKRGTGVEAGVTFEHVQPAWSA
jgi:riboflavin biosynthesis pyrimidine reductase